MEDEEENYVSEEKWEREKSWDKPGPVFMFLVFCLFISAFDSSQPLDVDKMSGPPAFYLFANIFHYFRSLFPLAFPFLVISSLPLLFFLLFMLLYSSIFTIYFPCLLHMIFLNVFDYCLPLFLSLRPFFIFSFICILYCLQVLSLISVYHVFSYCFCCFWASDIFRVCLNCFAMLFFCSTKSISRWGNVRYSFGMNSISSHPPAKHKKIPPPRTRPPYLPLLANYDS